MSSLEKPQPHQSVLRSNHQPTVAFLQSQSSIRIQGPPPPPPQQLHSSGGAAASQFLQQQLPSLKQKETWFTKSVHQNNQPSLDGSSICQNSTQISGSMAPISTSASLGNSILASTANQQQQPPVTGRSPIIGTRLGQLIVASRGQQRSDRRSNYLKQQYQQSPLVAYENNLVEDFELMKNVQNLIEENVHRCNYVPQENLIHLQDESKLFILNGSMGLMRRQNRISLQNSGSKVKNEIELLMNNQHQRYSSACPYKPENPAEYNVQEYMNQNIFLQGSKESIANRYMDTLGKLLRASQDSQFQDRNGPQSLCKPDLTDKTYIEIQEQLKQAGVFDLVDPNTGLRLVDAQGLMTLQRQKYVKSMQRHNKINFQKKNPAALYFQIAKQKAKQNLETSKEDVLQLVGNQFQPKSIPDTFVSHIEHRRASNEIFDQKEMLILLKRRHMEIGVRKNKLSDTSPMNMDKPEWSGDDFLSKRGDLTANDSTLKEIRDSIKLDSHNLEDSRQPQVGLQKSERLFHSNIRQRRFITQAKQSQQSNTNRSKGRDILVNLKQQNTISNSSRAKLMIEKTEASQSQQNSLLLDQIDEKVVRIPPAVAQQRRYYQMGNVQIETDEEKMERLIKFQKQIKAKYNDISLNQNLKDEPYRFIILRGNNSELIKRCLEDRSGDWQEISSANTLFNFKWAPFSRGIRFDYLSGHGMKKMVNHFEGHDQITEKDNLFFNMSKLYESQKRNVFQNLPVTFTLDCGSASYFTELERFQLFFTILEKHKQDEDRLAVINKEISSHHLFPSSKKSQAKYTLCENMFDGSNLWLLKPTDYNRGRGVQVFNSLEQLKRLLNDYQQGVEVKFSNQDNKVKVSEVKKPNSQPITGGQNEQALTNFTNLEAIPNIVKTNNFVIQKYLERPLLIKKRKFDIRLWVLVSHEGKCYLFKEGYIRTSSFEYDTSPDSLDKPFIHLTNNAVQCYCDNYGAFEEGNQLSLKQGSQLLSEDGIQCDLNSLVEGQVSEIIKDTLKSVESRLNQHSRKYCFEIFGYDFIIDRALNPWLIEVNTNPCLEESSGLLKVLIPRMVDDALKLTLDVIFPLKKGKKDCLSPTEVVAVQKTMQTECQIASKYSVAGYPDTESMWNLIYQLKV